jgi:cold shock CspA family protein
VTLGPGAGRRRGVVVAFDDQVGLGEVALTPADPAKGGRLRFHCTQIAGGSRTIAVGATVSFETLAGRGGQWEAADLRVEG